jgi:hypothetical protein
MRTPLLAAALLLAACSSPAPAGVTVRTSTQPTSVTEQGFRPLKLGQEAGLGCPSSNPTTCAVRFAVTSIDVSPACDPYRNPPPTGQKTVVLHVTMTTTQPEKADTARAGLLFSTVQLKAISPDGHTTGVDYGFCLDRPGALARDIGPNSTYEGFLEIAVDQAATSIATSKAQSDDPGWVWPLG